MIDLTFVFWVLGLLALPGPTNTLLFTLGAANSYRARASLLALAAAIAGYLVNVGALLLLATPAVAVGPAAEPLIRGLILLLLIYLAWKLWNEGVQVRDGGSVTPLRVAATTLFNPKGAVVAFAFWPEGARHDASQCLAALCVFGIIVAITGLFWLALGEGAARTAPVLKRPTVCCRVGAIAMLVFAAVLARGLLSDAGAVELLLTISGAPA